ncbi:unnamed protein product [marine sediment metagenome]|uniref:Uncharacterized protein n=1 Tax=marine sediment metagenome TaxID=412755 RepID=X0RL23_9ZZZZ
MKKVIKGMLCLLVCGSLFSFPAFAEEMSNYELMQELKALKEKTRMIEEKLDKQEKMSREEISKEVPTGLEGQGLPERVRRIEEKMEQKQEGVLGKWADKITLGVLMEVGAVYQDVDCKHGDCEADDDQSDISLTTVEIGLGVEVNEWVNLEVVCLYEDPTFGEESSVDAVLHRLQWHSTGAGYLFPKAAPAFNNLAQIFWDQEKNRRRWKLPKRQSLLAVHLA